MDLSLPFGPALIIPFGFVGGNICDGEEDPEIDEEEMGDGVGGRSGSGRLGGGPSARERAEARRARAAFGGARLCPPCPPSDEDEREVGRGDEDECPLTEDEREGRGEGRGDRGGGGGGGGRDGGAGRGALVVDAIA